MKCTGCGAELPYGRITTTLSYKGQSRTMQTEGWRCEACNADVFTGAPLEAQDQAFQELKTSVLRGGGDGRCR